MVTKPIRRITSTYKSFYELVETNPIVLWTSSTQFQSTWSGFNLKKIILGCNLTVKTRQILTQLNILSCNHVGLEMGRI
jgi:hypothetical protein